MNGKLRYNPPVPRVRFSIAALAMAAVTLAALVFVPAANGYRLPELPAPVIAAADGIRPLITIEVVRVDEDEPAAAQGPAQD